MSVISPSHAVPPHPPPPPPRPLLCPVPLRRGLLSLFPLVRLTARCARPLCVAAARSVRASERAPQRPTPALHVLADFSPKYCSAHHLPPSLCLCLYLSVSLSFSLDLCLSLVL
jgi:hypothetical protein